MYLGFCTMPPSHRHPCYSEAGDSTKVWTPGMYIEVSILEAGYHNPQHISGTQKMLKKQLLNEKRNDFNRMPSAGFSSHGELL